MLASIDRYNSPSSTLKLPTTWSGGRTTDPIRHADTLYGIHTQRSTVRGRTTDPLPLHTKEYAMSAQTHSLQTVPRSTTRRALPAPSAEMNLLPLFLAEQLAEAERRHRTLVTLEALYAETPVWCIGQRRAIRKAITSHLPSLWSWS
jgi:hypothetical protein